MFGTATGLTASNTCGVFFSKMTGNKLQRSVLQLHKATIRGLVNELTEVAGMTSWGTLSLNSMI